MKKAIIAVCILMTLFSLTACDTPERDVVAEAIPGRMVSKIDIAIHPADESFERCYTDIEHMSPVLRMLREMDTHDVPETEPRIDDGQSYYTITATYANGSSRIYYLLGHQFLRYDDEPWCVVESEKIMALIQFIRAHPDDEAVAVSAEEATVETAADPTAESVPEESTGETTAEESTDAATASE